MINQGKRSLVFILMFVIAAGALGFMPNRALAQLFSASDKLTEYTLPEGEAKIAGNQMVYISRDQAGWLQVFSRNLETGELKQLTDSQRYKQYLAAGGDYAVYLEDQQYIMLVNLHSGQATKAEVPPYPYDQFSTDGRYVVFYKPLEKTLSLYDITSGEIKPIGKGKKASIVNGIVVYVGESGNFECFNASDGTSRTLYRPSEGYIVSGRDYAFDGKTLVWIHGGSEEGYQTRMLSIDEHDPVPQVLSVYKDLGNLFSKASLGTTIAAWPERKNGANHIVAADLSSKQTDIAADNAILIGIYNDQLVLRIEDEEVVLRQLQKTGQGAVVTDTLISAVPQIGAPPRTTSANLEDEVNSRLNNDDNSVTITVKEDNTFHLDSQVSIAYAYDKQFRLTQALRPGQKMVSHPWELTFGPLRSPLKLSMSYMKQRVPSGDLNKLGIYRLESGAWTYLGGLFEQNNKYLYADIMKPGIYAVLYYDVPTPYVRDYWLHERINQLNANKPIRVFLDGEEIAFHQPPVLKDGSTAVEFRPIFEKLGLQIDWNDTTQSVTGTKQGQKLQLALGQTEALVNDMVSNLPTAPFLNEGYTFVPLRFVGEASGRKVLWDANLKAVYLYDPATEGKLYYETGQLMYEGQIANGQMNGKGKLYRKDGTLWYDAVFRNNDVLGPGVIYFAGMQFNRDRTGEVAIAEKFEDGRQTGYVINIDDNSFVMYEGETIRGIFNGKGKYYVESQLIYEGEYKDNLIDGFGKFYIDGKLEFEGHFLKNIPNGYGKSYMILSSDRHYLYEEGEYVDGQLHGKGILYYSSHSKSYEGQFVKGRKGDGTFYYPDGKIKATSTLRDGVRSGTIYYTNGERYEGEFEEAGMNQLNRHGKGTTYAKDGNVIFQGKYDNDRPVP